MDIDSKYFRRRATSFTWHWRKDCPRWPDSDFVEDQPPDDYKTSMLCLKCLALENEDKSKHQISDVRRSKLLGWLNELIGT